MRIDECMDVWTAIVIHNPQHSRDLGVRQPGTSPISGKEESDVLGQDPSIPLQRLSTLQADTLPNDVDSKHVSRDTR